MTIHLHDLLFFSHHGLHAEERILGNEYEVNAAIDIDVPGNIGRLEQTIDYAAVYKIISERMAVPTNLLETVVQDLVALIHAGFPTARSISIAIRKKYPPIAAMQGSVGVSYKKEF